MNQWINYHHLYYFMTIAESGSVSKAAEKLRLGQPTLSAQLKQFEDNLNVKLFDRQHKKLILTEQGRLALDYAKSIFKMGNEMYEALHDRLKPTKLSLQLGALDSIPKQVVLQLSQHAYKFADCSITLIEGKFDELVREINAHRVDIAISNFLPSTETAKGLYHRVVSKKPVNIYAAPKYKGLRKNFPESIIDKPFILPTHDSHLRYSLDHWFKLNNISVNVIAETQDTALNKLMAVNEMALIPAASHSVTRQVLKGELIEIGKLNAVQEELYLISIHRKISNPIAAELMKNFEI